MYIYIYIYIYVCVCVCVFTFIYIHTYTTCIYKFMCMPPIYKVDGNLLCYIPLKMHE